MSLFLFGVAVLGVWRVTHLLHAEDGPWDLVARLRAKARGRLATSVLGCFYCLSVWVALPFALIGDGWTERALAWPALSAGAILTDLLATRLGVPPAAYFRDEEDDDGLLRQDDRAQ